MTPFNIPSPPVPFGEPGSAGNTPVIWQNLLQWAFLKQDHEKAVDREKWDGKMVTANEALAVANAAFAASNDRLAEAMVEAARMQLEAASLPTPPAPVPVPPPVVPAPPLTDAQILLQFMTAGLAAGEDGSALTSDAVAAVKAYRTATKTASI